MKSVSPPAPLAQTAHRDDRREPLRIAVIGGGAVAEKIHLPALTRTPGVIIAGLAELDGDRRRRLADEFSIPLVVSDYHELLGSIDAAIVALPHHLHSSVAVELLTNHIHVLVEKPMALSTRECDAMIVAAESASAVLAVGLVRRFALSHRFTKHALASGLLGNINHFSLTEGRVYDWDVASAFAFERESGGVLADVGAHALDLILWWFGDCAEVAYFDDARGGVEADCYAELRMDSEVPGTIELSRSRTLPNLCTIQGSRGSLQVGTKLSSHLQLKLHGNAAVVRGALEVETPASEDVFRLQIDDFVCAVRDGRSPAVSGIEGRRSAELIQRCYRERQPIVRSWDSGETCIDLERR
jgi:predicted dehydrogenase